MNSVSHFINGIWLSGSGTKFSSRDPGTFELVWQGCEATLQEADHAVYAARGAFASWSRKTFDDRLAVLNAFKKQLDDNKLDLAETISRENGKPLWEALTEVTAMIGKIGISATAFAERSRDAVRETSGELSATRFKPHGVVAVFGPFNFPGHLANGHIVPALLAGNTVIYKQSELTPLVGQKIVELWENAGIPPGVLNLVQGGRATGQALAGHPGLDGLFFTGSSQVGLVLARQFAEHPEKILALEMGGNNPLIVWEPQSARVAAYLVVQSAFITAGQRCTCARRLILPDGGEGDAVLDELIAMTSRLKVGHFQDRPEPFMGPVISAKAADAVIAEQQRLLADGAKILAEAQLLKLNTGLVTPGIVDVTGIAREDKEVFGPLLTVIRVKNFESAMDEANNTRYGLAAGLVSRQKDLYDIFYRDIRAGIVNWNRPTTGASSSAPFGGVGLSGNHRPSAYFAADYCSYPVASMESATVELPKILPPGVSL